MTPRTPVQPTGALRVVGLLSMMVTILASMLMTAPAAPAASAHPLGNFTVNSFSGLEIGPDSVAVEVIVDSAEIPTVQEFPLANDVAVPPTRAQAYAETECARLLPGLDLSIGGQAAVLELAASSLSLAPGQAGLQTMRLACQARTSDPVSTLGEDLTYVDQNSLQRTGWREIVASGSGVALTGSNVDDTSVSDRLSSYPTDLLTSPLDTRQATTQIVAGTSTGTGTGTGSTSDATAPGPASAGWIVETFTQLVAAKNLTFGFAVLALLISVVLGALHAFSPGHGKTLMAAYLLGQRSSLRQVAIIGATVTVTHTMGVLVLGLVLTGLAVTAPTAIYGWLGLASGVLLIGIGLSLLRQARHRAAHLSAAPERVAELVHASTTDAPTPTGHPPDHGEHHDPDQDHHHDRGHDHDHDRGHGHDHGHGEDKGGSGRAKGLSHSHGWGGTHTHPPVATSARGMLAVGFAGGMVPSPSALIVLLGGIALGRAWFGVLLVIGYGIGMALALVGVGLTLSRGRDRLQRWAENRRRTDQSAFVLRAMRSLPTATSALVIVAGLVVATRSGLQLWLVPWT